MMARTLILLCGLSVLLTSCASYAITPAYDGPQRSAAEVAILKDKLNQVQQVDGRRWSRSDGKLTGGYELLPGQHSVTVDVSTMTMTAQPLTASFVAESGHTYEVKAGVTPVSNEWTLSIKDMTTGQIVSQ